MMEAHRGIDTKLDKLVRSNLLDSAATAMGTQEQQFAKLQLMATSYLKKGNVCSDPTVSMAKLNYLQNAKRQQFENPDKKLSDARED